MATSLGRQGGIGLCEPESMRVATVRDPGGTVGVGEIEGEAVHLLQAPSMLAWLAGEGRERTGAEHVLESVGLLAPVPDPPSVRDFYAFEGHVAAGWRRRGGEIPRYWYEAPAFYFSNPASIRGPGEPVTPPGASDALDFELEIAAVIGAGAQIAGFTLMNDWSARDIQADEVTVGLGPHKAKDFATSLGPWLATPDELPYEDGRLRLTATVSVNGRELSRCDAGEQHFSWPDLASHAGRDTRLRPGDVLGSGTLTGGCLLELGPQDFGDGRGERWIEPGDVVTIAAPDLGALETPVVG
jgi:fumarylacetoacetate (FAA) hydrolase